LDLEEEFVSLGVELSKLFQTLKVPPCLGRDLGQCH